MSENHRITERGSDEEIDAYLGHVLHDHLTAGHYAAEVRIAEGTDFDYGLLQPGRGRSRRSLPLGEGQRRRAAG